MTPEELKILSSLNINNKLLKAIQDKDNKQQSTTKQLSRSNHLDLFITQDPKMISVKNKAQVLAKADLNVLIIGETGTGKELLARALHDTRNGPFVGFDCSTVHPELMESELFGVTKGAYTGCFQDRIGLIESAKGGTLFLDEVTNMPVFLQCKLLRVIEARELRRLGSNEFRSFDCRIVAATNNSKIPNEHFREDLFWRLKGSLLETTPLAKRRQDIRLIAQFYDKEHKINPSLINMWVEEEDIFQFRGNARELKNLVIETIVLSELIDKL